MDIRTIGCICNLSIQRNINDLLRVKSFLLLQCLICRDPHYLKFYGPIL